MNAHKILIVDDEELVRESIIDCLPLNYEPIEAADGLEALELAKAHHISAIVTDYNMPLMNGHEFVKSLHEQGVSAPVICLTGRGSHELHRDMWIRGACEYVEKPFEPESLSRTIRLAVETGLSVKEEKNYRGLASSVSVDLAINLGKNTAEKIQKIAVLQGCSVSSLVEKLIEEYIRNH